MASAIYNNAKALFANGGLDWDTNTFKVLLVTSAYTPNIDTHTSRADVTGEVTGTGYTAGGDPLANCTVTVDNTNDRAKLDADDVVWVASTITARGAVIYRSNGGVASGDPLVCYVDFGVDVTSTNGNFTITWNAAGILTLS